MGIFRGTGFLAATFFLDTFFADTFFFDTFLTAFFLAGALRATFFFEAFFLAGFFLLAFFLAAGFFFATFFLLTFFRATAFFLLTFFREDFFATGFFRAADFFLVDVFFLLALRPFTGVFLRLDALREAAFLAAIWKSCRSGKGGNYTLMAATWKPRLAGFSGLFEGPGRAHFLAGLRYASSRPKSTSGGGILGIIRGSDVGYSYCSDNRFIVKIALHYPDLTGYGRYTSTCD